MNAFDKLDLQIKAEMLRDEGIAVTTVIFYNYYVTLFILDGFLVERYYSTETKMIVKISSVQYFDLDKYLHHIDINQVYGLFH